MFTLKKPWVNTHMMMITLWCVCVCVCVCDDGVSIIVRGFELYFNEDDALTD
jgi:hypothetical protein